MFLSRFVFVLGEGEAVEVHGRLRGSRRFRVLLIPGPSLLDPQMDQNDGRGMTFWEER